MEHRSGGKLIRIMTAVIPGAIALTGFAGVVGLIGGGLTFGSAINARLPFGSLVLAGLALLAFAVTDLGRQRGAPGVESTRFFRRWRGWTTLGESTGFAVAAVAGVITPVGSTKLIAWCRGKLVEHAVSVRDQLQDLPEIRNWTVS
jgi:hypothetical protein